VAGQALLLGNEIDKLACSIWLGRDSAGVQDHADSIQGLVISEQQVGDLLRDQSQT
jgi:hypothetical protein